MSDRNVDHAAILAPDQVVSVGGEDVTVREFSWAESLKAAPMSRAIIEEFRKLFADGPDYDVQIEDLEDIFGRHQESFLQLVALATGKKLGWLRKLSSADGQLMLLTFWNTNSGFFTERLRLSILSRAKSFHQPSSSAH